MSAVRDRDGVFADAMRLSESDRLELVDRLLATLPDELPGLNSDDPNFADELLRRSGDAEGSVAWEQLRDELRHQP